MSDASRPDGVGVDAEAGPATEDAGRVATASALLKQARERSGLHVVALAAMLKVPVKKLEALEAGRFHELPDMTFARALAASVCRHLKVDAGDILALLPQSDDTRLGAPTSLNTPFKAADSYTGAAGAPPAKVPRPVLFAVGVLLLAGLVWFLVPERAGQEAPAAQPEVSAPVPVAPAAPATTGTPDSAVEVPAPGTTEAPAEAGDAPTLTPAGAAVVGDADRSAAIDASGVLVIRTTAVSWVEVIASSGSVLVQREVAAGETLSFASGRPFRVVVGRADGVEVLVRGAALDLAPYARNNVARFEVE